MDIFKAATYGMALVGVPGLFNPVVTQHLHDIDLAVFALVSNGILTLGAVCFFVFGVGMYRGRSEFAPD